MHLRVSERCIREDWELGDGKVYIDQGRSSDRKERMVKAQERDTVTVLFPLSQFPLCEQAVTLALITEGIGDKAYP